MMWLWHSTSNFTTCHVAYYDRKWHLPSAKSTRLNALVTMRITARANAWRKVVGVMGVDANQVNLNEICSARVDWFAAIHECTRDDGTNKETTGESPSLRKTTW